jgi:hypothetical protein
MSAGCVCGEVAAGGKFAAGAFGGLAYGDRAATFGDTAGGEFPLQAAPKAASDAVAPRFASLARSELRGTRHLSDA